MATLAITFRFHNDDTRADRYESFIAYFDDKVTWDETTSFILLQTTETAAKVALDLYTTEFDPSIDKLMVIDVTNAHAVTEGDIKRPVRLRKLLPKVILG